jgi:hypothetical protein
LCFEPFFSFLLFFLTFRAVSATLLFNILVRAFSRNGANQTLHIPLSQLFGFTRDLDSVTRGIQWQMILHKQADTLALHCAAGADGADKAPKLYISKMKWWVCHARPSLGIDARINQQLNEGMVQNLDWMEVSCFKSPAFQEANPRFRISSQVRDPLYAFVACMPTATAGAFRRRSRYRLSWVIRRIELVASASATRFSMHPTLSETS